MAIQRDDHDEGLAGLASRIEEYRAATKNALVKRGIALWTRTEVQQRVVRRERSLPPERIN